ncbi:hypothetical protein CSAL01_03395 [Colletotrichum salicis]|uniref:Uncharacterized protein n=1 Tax=Colletotrichum salicis TaxID=1209931 RepID=A0A135TTX5_9PEZI|nr:hypothetical protein CSAL01_03395 [Colletotrichum salicis]
MMLLLHLPLTIPLLRHITTTPILPHPHIPIPIPNLTAAPAPTPTPTPPITALTLTPAPTATPPLPNKPQRLLQHQKIPLQHLGPILHIPQLFHSPRRVPRELGQLIILLAQRLRRPRDVALLLVERCRVGVQHPRAGL